MIKSFLSSYANLGHNVMLTYYFTLTSSSARAIIFNQILSGYIFTLTNSNKFLGIAMGLIGISQLITTFPAGYAADHYRRDSVLFFAAILGFISCIISFIGFLKDELTMLLISFFFWGFYMAVQTPALEALFADSVPQGQRSFPYTIKYVLLNTSQILAPLISILIFHIYGNTWSLPELRCVLLFGTILGASSLLLLLFFDDDKALENLPTKDSRGKVENLALEKSESDYETISTTDEETGIQKTESEENHLPKNSFYGLNRNHVPHLIFTSDFIMRIGAGMTIAFFPTFFLDEYGLSPINLNILFLGQPIFIILFSFIIQHYSIKFGRLYVILISRWLSALCLLYMAFAKSIWIQICMFLLRGASMRSTEALRRSLFMDHIPKSRRARWNSLEGLVTFTWTGSAVLGGYIIDAHGYRYCFKITFCFYFIGLLFELLLLPITDRFESDCLEPKN